MSLENQLGSDGETDVSSTLKDQTELITLSNSALLNKESSQFLSNLDLTDKIVNSLLLVGTDIKFKHTRI